LTGKAKEKQATEQVEELAPWEVPPVEGEQDTDGAQVVPAGVATVPADPDSAMQNMMEWCVEYEQEHAADNAAVMAAEVARILAGEDAEAVLSESAPLAGKDHTEKPFLLTGFTLNPTDFSEGWPFFASMQCSVPGQGQNFVLNCGGPKVIAALMRLHQLGEYPYALKLRGKTTKAGYTVLQLVHAGA
jgi:hypothetical protein